MKYVNCLLLIVLMFITNACKHKPLMDVPEAESEISTINFSELKLGQKNVYIHLIGENYFDNNAFDFEYTADTLIQEIISEDENGFLVEEYLTPGSAVFEVEQPYIYHADSLFQFYLNIESDSIKFEKHPDFINNYSKMYGFYNFPGLPLADITENETEIMGWKTGLPYCECRQTGFVTNYTLFEQDFNHLSVIIENTPMTYDGNGMTYVYSKSHGLVRYSEYGWWTQSGYGWDLLGSE